MTFAGSDEYALKLDKLANSSGKIVKKAIYNAAALVTDAIRSNINALEEAPEYVGSQKKPIHGLTKRQKQGLLDGLGFSPVNQDKKGFWNSQIGYEGYNDVKTEKFPQGQPNLLIARAVESGTSFRIKTPFVRPAVQKTRTQAVKAMEKVIDEASDNIMNGG